MSAVEVNKVNPSSGTNLQLGDSGDTITIPAGATFDSSAATNTLPANVVTTDGTQTLTNKSIVATQLTGTITPSDNTVSIAKLTATGTKDATTFLRGDNTFAEAGGGKLLQSVLTTANTEQTISSATFADLTGMTVNITPVSLTSKFLITAYVNVALLTSSGGSIDIGWNSKILRDSTTVVNNAVTSSYGSVYYYQGGSNLHLFDTIIGEDDHNTTSQVTIKVQGREPEGNTAKFNLASAKNSYLLVQEIET